MRKFIKQGENGHIVVALNAIQHDVTAGSGEDVLIYITVEQHLLKQQNHL